MLHNIIYRNKISVQHIIVSSPKTSTVSLRTLFSQCNIPMIFSHNFINKQGIFSLLILPEASNGANTTNTTNTSITRKNPITLYSENESDSVLNIIQSGILHTNTIVDFIYIYMIYRNPFDIMISSYLQFHKKDPKKLLELFERNRELVTADFNNFITTGFDMYGMNPMPHHYLHLLDIDIFKTKFDRENGGNFVSSVDDNGCNGNGDGDGNGNKKFIAVLGCFDKLDIFKADVETVLGHQFVYPVENVSIDVFGVDLCDFLTRDMKIDSGIVDFILENESQYISHFYGDDYLNDVVAKYR